MHFEPVFLLFFVIGMGLSTSMTIPTFSLSLRSVDVLCGACSGSNYVFSMHIIGSDHYLVMFLSIYYLQHFPLLYLSIFSDFNHKVIPIRLNGCFNVVVPLDVAVSSAFPFQPCFLCPVKLELLIVLTDGNLFPLGFDCIYTSHYLSCVALFSIVNHFCILFPHIPSLRV